VKTILQALIDEVHYPVGIGHLENRLIKRGLSPNDLCSQSILESSEFIGAYADCLWGLIAAPNISEADKSISGLDRDLIISQMNNLYELIGEPAKTLGKPIIYIVD